MAQSEEFRRLLAEAVYRISVCEGNKPIRVVQDEVGYALNKRGGGSAVEYWRQGHLPKMADVEKLARVIIERSDLDQPWLAQFLQSAGYPHDQALCRELFPGNSPPQTQPPEPVGALTAPPPSPLLFLPNKPYRTLVGREALVSEALAALQDDQGRWIVAIDGIGGIGKTALAREVVVQVTKLGLFERIVWVSAAYSAGPGIAAQAETPMRQPHTTLTLDGILNAIVLQLGLPSFTHLTEAEKTVRVQAMLRRQRTLVVLDNLETAADPQAWLIDRLYAMLNPSKALCTSRRRFVGNVYAIHLMGLSERAGVQFIRQEAHERRVLAITTMTDELMAQICVTTGGSPLALKLVVGQLGYLPLEIVLTHLRQAQNLSSGIAGVQESQFYHAIYVPSWQLLSPTGQQLLTAMSLFVPGVGAPVAVITKVSGLREAALIVGLQEGWQLSWLETAPAEDDEASAIPLRYYIHPLTAHFLVWEICRFGEQTRSTDQSQMKDSQREVASDCFITFTRCLTNALHHLLAQIDSYGAVAPSTEVRQWAMHLLNYALKVPANWPIISQVLIKLAPKMEQAGHRRDWLPYVLQGIEVSRVVTDDATAAEMHLQAGMLYQLLGEYESAELHFTSSANAFHGLGDQQNQARAINRLAYVARLQHHYDDAAHLAQAALGLLSAADPEYGSSHTVLGAIALDFQQWEEAAHHFRQSLALWQPQGNKRMIARRLRDLGPALRAQKHYAEATACYEQAILLFGEIEDPIQQAVTRVNLGVVYTAMGQPAQAIDLYRQAEPVFRQTYDERQLAMLFNNLGLAYQAQQQRELARDAYSQSIDYWQAVGDIAATASTMDGLGSLYIEQQAYENAVEIYQQALALLSKLKEDASVTKLWAEVTQHLQAATFAQSNRLENLGKDSPAYQA